MKIFGLEIKRATKEKALLQPVDDSRGWTKIFDWAPGRWQQHAPISTDSTECLLANSAIYACASLIAADVAKLRPRLYAHYGSHGGYRQDVTRAASAPQVLHRPNRYQTNYQFYEGWMLSKLTFGNAYALKRRDSNGAVYELTVLDPRLVTPMVTESGDIWYQLKTDSISAIEDEVMVPHTEIIHDRGPALYHPLIGSSPIAACAWSGTIANKIAANSAAFFGNHSQPGGLLVAPGAISETTASALKQYWDENFSGTKSGKVAVLADGLTYQSMSVTAHDAELVAQLDWTATDVARAFKIPAFMIAAAPVPQGVSNAESLIGLYYSQCLQAHIESLESVLNLGLELGRDHEVEFDLNDLMKTDSASRFASYKDAIAGGWATPNEIRRREKLPPITGGDSAYLQQQCFSLEALSKRDQREDPFATAPAQSRSLEDSTRRDVPSGRIIYK